jgi:hypothetical protein
VKKLVLAALVVCVVAGQARAEEGQVGGFQFHEAMDMMDMSIDLNGTGDGSPKTPPKDWTPLYTAGEKGFGPFDNAWKLWKKDEKTYAIAVRGTTEDVRSIKADILATSLPAQKVELEREGNGQVLRFCLAATDQSEVHLGFTYSMTFLMFHRNLGILKQVRTLPAGSKIYVTGHSQGAAIATLVHAFLHYALRDGADRYGLKDKGFILKSYLFAQPKPGNWQFAMDFAKIAGADGRAYTVNNTLDWVPQVPVTVQFLDEPVKELVAEALTEQEQQGFLARFKVGAVEKKWLTERIEKLIDFAGEIRAKVSGKVAKTVIDKVQAAIGDLDPAYFVDGHAGPGKKQGSSLNYTAAGNLVTVTGSRTQDVDIQHDGWLAQHHAGAYRTLISEQLKEQ